MTPVRARAVLHACGVVAAAAWCALAWLSHRAGPPDLAHYLVLIALPWSATAVAAWVGSRGPELRLGDVIVWAVVFRAVAFAGAPLFEDDFWRYLWDGWRVVDGLDPYARPPADFFADASVPAAMQVVLDGVNHPDHATLYAPLCQLAFGLAHLVEPGALWPLKLVWLCVDALALAALARLAPPRGLLLFAWCPLWIQEIGFSAHLDGLALAAVVGSLAATRARRPGLAGALLGAACGARLFAWLLVPFLLARAPRRAWLVFAVVAAALWLPVLAGGRGTPFDSVGTMALEFRFNASVVAALAPAFGDAAARGLAYLALALGLWALWRARLRSDDPLPRGEHVFALAFLLSPVVNPWYLLWLLPFAALRPSAWSFAALAVAPLSYAHGLFLPGSGLAPYQQPAWVVPVQLTAIATAACVQHWRASRGRVDAAPASATPTRPSAATAVPIPPLRP